MARFMFAYHGGGRPETPEEGEKMMAAWNKWIEDLGSTMVEPGNPVGQSYTVSAEGTVDNGGANPIMGYSVVETESIEAALKIAESSPHLMMKGASIEVAQMFEM